MPGTRGAGKLMFRTPGLGGTYMGDARVFRLALLPGISHVCGIETNSVFWGGVALEDPDRDAREDRALQGDDTRGSGGAMAILFIAALVGALVIAFLLWR